MKRMLACLLALVCLMLPVGANAMGFSMPKLTVPEDSSVFSASFAAQVIALNQTNPQMLALMGLKTVHQANFDKDPKSAEHTCAYTVCQGSVEHRGETRTLMLVIIRATEGGEWYSNFDCAPSQDNDTQYAENFYAAAQDVHAGIHPIIEQVENPIVVVTGYSRGAACANLLGMLLNEELGAENVYVYTAGTPTTVRGEAANTVCPNIFNIINPADLITCLPPSSWGYTRLGTDIVLPADEALVQQVEATMAHFATIAPDISSYYTVRHSLTGAGESPLGLTTYEVMLRLADKLTGNIDMQTLMLLQQLSPESDFAPLAQVFLASADDPANLLNQHDPTAYLALFDKMQ